MAFGPIIRIGKSSVGVTTLSRSANAGTSDVLQKRTTSHSLKAHIVNYLKNETRSFEYTLQVMKTLERQVHNEIRRLGGNHGLEAILAMLYIPTAPPVAVNGSSKHA